MFELWIPLNDIPADGRDFSFSDQLVWRDRWKDFGLRVSPGRDLVATVRIQPQGDQAALVRGRLAGSVTVPCDRCAAEFECVIDTEFDLFEELPKEGENEGEEARVRLAGEIAELDMAAILWEEFVLALPMKPLCSEDCKGLCPGCGVDLNKGECICDREEGDPRLAVFRNMKIK